MKPEIEATFININKDELRSKIIAAGGKILQAETLMKRVIFSLNNHSFLRVRDEGNRIVMTYKNVESLSLSGSKEINVEVSNYQDTIDILKASGLKAKAVQETLREEWELDEVELDIDTWPWIPSYVEIEGPSEESVQNVANKLGFDMKDAHYGSVDQIYKLYYDVTSDDINYCPEIKFAEIPDWLENKRRSK